MSQWPVAEPLPSYGRGMDLPGPSHRSLINGQNLIDVVITGKYNLLRHPGFNCCCVFSLLKIHLLQGIMELLMARVPHGGTGFAQIS